MRPPRPRRLCFLLTIAGLLSIVGCNSAKDDSRPPAATPPAPAAASEQGVPPSSQPTSTEPPPAGAPAALEITATDLTSAYDDDEKAAKAKYNGKPLLVTGVIREIRFGDTPQESSQITLAGKDAGGHFPPKVGFSVKDRGEAEKLGVGQTIKVRGKVWANTKGSVDLWFDAKIVEATPLTPEQIALQKRIAGEPGVLAALKAKNVSADADRSGDIHISLSDEQFTDDGRIKPDVLELLQKLVRVKKIRLGPITDAGLEGLSGMTNLEELSLDGTKVTDAGLKSIAGMTRLLELTLGGNITDAGYAPLKALTRLETLRVRETESAGFTDAALANFHDWTRLEHLEIPRVKITGAGLANFKGMTNLAVIELQHSTLTDAGLPHLAALPKLHELDISSTKITDDGLEVARRGADPSRAPYPVHRRHRRRLGKPLGSQDA